MRISGSMTNSVLRREGMQLFRKRFQELTIEELYRLMKVRVAVFVVEQNCPYMELDDCDQNAIHIWLEDEEGIQAYLRVMDRGVENDHIYLESQVYAKGLYEKQGFRQISGEFLLDGIPHVKMLLDVTAVQSRSSCEDHSV